VFLWAENVSKKIFNLSAILKYVMQLNPPVVGNFRTGAEVISNTIDENIPATVTEIYLSIVIPHAKPKVFQTIPFDG